MRREIRFADFCDKPILSVKLEQVTLGHGLLAEHQEAVLAMVDAYSRDAMGNGKPLDQDVRTRLIPGLRRHPTTLIFLAFDGVQPIGAAVCFIGFSSFAAKPIINIHDFVVLPTSRGKGIGRRLLEGGRSQSKGTWLLQVDAGSDGQKSSGRSHVSGGRF